MAAFKSWSSYNTFSTAVRFGERYHHSPATRRFLRTVLETAKSRITVLKAGTELFRSQQGHDWKPIYVQGHGPDHMAVPYSAKRMLPLKDEAKEGRANPKGIPCVYASNDANTAMSEARPWIGEQISLAMLRLTKDVRIVDCTKDKGVQLIYLTKCTPAQCEKATWGYINRAFSTPVTHTDSLADYVPTQILAELFKTNGYDGVAYRSSLGKGHNVSLFDLGSVEFLGCILQTVKSVEYKFSDGKESAQSLFFS